MSEEKEMYRLDQDFVRSVWGYGKIANVQGAVTWIQTCFQKAVQDEVGIYNIFHPDIMHALEDVIEEDVLEQISIAMIMNEKDVDYDELRDVIITFMEEHKEPVTTAEIRKNVYENLYVHMSNTQWNKVRELLPIQKIGDRGNVRWVLAEKK